MRKFLFLIAVIAATLSAHAVWLSPDPLLDKYPNISPYTYCNNNPIKSFFNRGYITKDNNYI